MFQDINLIRKTRWVVLYWGGPASEFPTFHILYSQFLPPSFVLPVSMCFFYCKKLLNVAKFLFYSSQLLSLWVSCPPPSLLLSPVDFPPPLLPGSCPPVPLHLYGCKVIHIRRGSTVHVVVTCSKKKNFLGRTTEQFHFLFSYFGNLQKKSYLQ